MKIPPALVLTVMLLSTALAGPSTQPHDQWHQTDDGWLMLRSFTNAPYPHKSRDNGFTNKAGVNFPKDKHYSNSTVGIIIPNGFKPAEQVDLVVHFHGHGNYVENCLDQFGLAAQLVKSGMNAILIVPQGPYMVSDSGSGKMEDENGFANLINEVVNYLHAEGKVSATTIGRIVLAGHSGGYKAMSLILHHGGMNDHITDVLLFDASYGGLEYFADWIAQKGKVQGSDRRLVSIFTQHLADENFELMTLLRKRQVEFDLMMDRDMTADTLEPRKPIFIHTQELSHGEVISKRDFFALWLTTSALP